MTMKKVMTSIFAVMLAAAVALVAAGCSGGGSSEGIYNAGTYTGEGKGMGGTIEVTLTFDDKSIVSVDEITDPGETVGIGGKEAIEDGTYADQIIAAQGFEIDGVTGATITSTGVKNAVEDAIGQALK